MHDDFADRGIRPPLGIPIRLEAGRKAEPAVWYGPAGARSPKSGRPGIAAWPPTSGALCGLGANRPPFPTGAVGVRRMKVGTSIGSGTGRGALMGLYGMGANGRL